MTRRSWGAAAAAALATLAAAGPAQAADPNRIEAFKAYPKNSKQLETLAKMGLDVTEGHGRGTGIEVPATAAQARKIRAAGIRVRLMRDRKGRTLMRAQAAQADAGWKVWRPYARTDVKVSAAAGNDTDNLMTQLRNLERDHPNLVDVQEIGRTWKNVPILAARVTRNPRRRRDGSRPAVLYSATQHAREWLATETSRRTLRLFVDNYGRRGTALGVDGKPVEGVDARELTTLVNTRELWFVIVANPDGYDFTFDPEWRLWRKNLRDTNNSGKFEFADGVDLNRNFPTHWGYDDEGSSSDPASFTYRGPSPASEPETRALDGLMNRVRFAWNKNDHTYGRLILYPFGWQIDTHAADEPIFRTIAGVDDDHPAIPTFDPDLGAELYTTNGDTNDHAYDKYKTISFTPEGTPGDSSTGSGFIFQDVEADVQAEFERHVQFSLDLARSAQDPSRPTSWRGNTVPNFELDAFAESWGSPQTVEVNARRDLGKVTLRYQINGGATRTAATSEFEGGERYGDKGDYWYHRLRGTVTGAEPGDEVKVWFTAEEASSPSFTYAQKADSNRRVLILANEDYTGTSQIPNYASTTSPNFLTYYTQALADNGIAADVFDVDAQGYKAPHRLGVLSHYDAVVWYTGNDVTTRNFTRGGVASKTAHDLMMSVRDFLNEGGRLLYTGKNAGYQHNLVEYPEPGQPPTACDGTLTQNQDEKCLPLSNDFLQYWLGAYVRSGGAGYDGDHQPLPVNGFADPFRAFSALLNGADSAGNHDWIAGIETANLLATSSILKPDRFPHFADSHALAAWGNGEGGFKARTGDGYMASDVSDSAWKRLTRTVDLTGKTSASLDFWANWNVEVDWDWLIVEARTTGQDDWTTLAEKSGRTSSSTGASCPAGDDYLSLHPFAAHYLTRTGTGSPASPYACTAGGTTGEWHQVTGTSTGYERLTYDLPARFAGKQVELSISVVSDWAVSEVPGVLVDDVTITRDGVAESTSFESDTGGWSVSGPPSGSNNSNDWSRQTGRVFEQGAIIGTTDTLYFGFGVEGITGRDARKDLMGRAMGKLLGPGA